MSAIYCRRLPPLAIHRNGSLLLNRHQSLSTFQPRNWVHTQSPISSRSLLFASSHSPLLQHRFQKIDSFVFPSRFNSSPANQEKDESSSQKAVSRPSASDQTRMQKIWVKVKTEASHYWHGTKLLGKEIRLSAKYQMKLLRGKKLTRREKRQLKRTTTDLLRLIPFSVFLIVPFMELLLPVALKLFPNMLPSTFRDESKELEKKRKLLKVRLEMAKFLQETLRESGMSKRVKETEEFKEFFRKVRSTGEKPSMDDVVKVARLFEDDLTLDNLSRPQLVSMCRYMNINAFGTDNFLRYTIRNRMRHLAADDALIDAEGIESLSGTELRHACQSRGIRSMGVDEAELRKELEQWIDLHLHRGLSATLLILGRAFAFNRGGDSEKGDSTLESLKDALSSLPDTLLNEAELEVSHDTVTNKQRLAVLEEQEELIADESEQELREEEARKAQRELERSQKAEAEELEKMEKVVEVALDKIPESKSEAEAVDPDNVRMTSEQLHELGEALSILSAKSSVLHEKTELKKLVEENQEAAQDPENTASAGLVKSIQKMIHEIDTQLEEYDTQVGNRMHQINIGKDGNISVDDLRKGLGVIKHRPSDEAIEVLIDKLDVDHDGFVPLEHVVSLAAEEGLGIVVDEDSSSNAIVSEGQKLRHDGHKNLKLQSKSRDARSKSESGVTNKEEPKPKKSDIVEDP
ncbi:uncharacterized protein MELLADRAFT_79269, partial [Melampsora larici-populina 98AG31]